MVLTAKQELLIKSQWRDPIYMYTNPKTNEVNFGLVRLKKTCLYITLSLRPLLSRDLIAKTGKSIEFDLKSYGLTNLKGEIIKISPK